MKVYAIYEDGRLVALCSELVAASTLQAELYYEKSEVQEIEIDETRWKELEGEK